MQSTARICRTQEAHQRAISLNAPLLNVRMIAARAAATWEKEALAAERREARAERTVALRDAGAVVDLPLPRPGPLDERSLSENPDSGFADA